MYTTSNNVKHIKYLYTNDKNKTIISTIYNCNINFQVLTITMDNIFTESNAKSIKAHHMNQGWCSRKYPKIRPKTHLRPILGWT